MSSTATPHNKDFTVAIVGGGVCGLACAVALTQAGVPVHVFEAASKFEEIGAGVSIGPNALRVLSKIGVLDAVLDKAMETELNYKPIIFVSGMEGHEVIYDYALSSGERSLGVHRAAFLGALVNKIDPAITHLKKRCVSVSSSPHNTNRKTIRFADGTEFEADVVIGADGIKSAVRGAILGHGIESVAFSNTVAYRGLVPFTAVREAGVTIDIYERPHCIGKDKHIICFPIHKGEVEMVNVVVFVANNDIPIGAVSLPQGEPWVTPVTEAELLQEFEGWAEDIINLLKCLRAPSKWSVHVVHPPLDSYVNGRVALIGDAAHGMLPHLGAGAGQSIEDAFVIARLLGHPETTATNVEMVLQAYDNARRPQAQMVWEGSRATGRVYDCRGPHGSTTEGIRQDLIGQWTAVWDHNLEDQIQKACAWLRDTGAFRTSSES